MSDTGSVIDGLGLMGNPQGDAPESTEDQPAAADFAATSDEASDDTEEISVAEALAELDGTAAPDAEASPETADLDADPAPDDVAEMRRQLDAYKAQEAEAQAQQADVQFLEPWRNQQAINDDYFEAEVARIQALGAQEGRTQAEIDAAIYNRVELGNGFGIQRINPQSRQPELVGRIAADAELQENLRRAAVAYERNKTRPDAFQEMASKYTLDADDIRALGKYRNYPPDHLEAMMQDYHFKNQRLSATQTSARTEAVANVRARYERQPAPGVPGAAPKVRQLRAPTNAAEGRQLTEYVTAKFFGMRPTGS